MPEGKVGKDMGNTSRTSGEGDDEGGHRAGGGLEVLRLRLFFFVVGCWLRRILTRWWQLKYFLFSPRKLGKIAILTNIFQMG